MKFPAIDRMNSSPLSAVEKRLANTLLQCMGNPPIFITLPDGSECYGTERKPKLGFRILNQKTLWRFLTNPSLCFGEDYAAGHIEITGNLVDFLLAVYQSRPQQHQMNWLSRYVTEGLSRRHNNGYAHSKANVYHHYDIGNDFYKLWLDRDMVYTCAYYEDVDSTLEQAQFAKLDYVCRKLRLQAGETVVEAGCGWGALALHMARYYGVQVKAFNLSKEQIGEARLRARHLQLQHRVEFIEDDYRNIAGRYDAFVSVGMLEHVGTAHYRQLGRVIDRCLAEQGRGLIHSIGQNRAAPLSPWLVKHIFPGAYAPTIGEMTRIFEPQSFSILDVENLRLHYARTCQNWLDNFERRQTEIRSRFDDRFVRTWRLYLAGSVVNFICGDMQLFQVVFSRPRVNAFPSTRTHLYQKSQNSDQPCENAMCS